MTDDDAGRRAENLRRPPRRILMAQAVESIAADAHFGPFIRTRIDVRLRRERRMKAGIEYRNLWHVRTEDADRRVDRLQFKRIVRRRDFRRAFNRRANLRRNARGVPVLASMHNAMRHCIQRTGRGAEQRLQIFLRFDAALPQRRSRLRCQTGNLLQTALHAAGAPVDGQDSHFAAGHVQFLISGMSSPYCEMYSLWSISLSRSICLRCPATP